jgi:hypothetical protein
MWRHRSTRTRRQHLGVALSEDHQVHHRPVRRRQVGEQPPAPVAYLEIVLERDGGGLREQPPGKGRHLTPERQDRLAVAAGSPVPLQLLVGVRLRRVEPDEPGALAATAGEAEPYRVAVADVLRRWPWGGRRVSRASRTQKQAMPSQLRIAKPAPRRMAPMLHRCLA